LSTTMTRSSGGAAVAAGAIVTRSAIARMVVSGLRTAVPFPQLRYKLATSRWQLKP
jgi:hypothetical protein